jgi:ubiquinone biosynthesis protein UbiJ
LFLSPVLADLVARPINHVLARNSWALERLKPFAGKAARFECLPFALTLRVRPDGRVDIASQAAPDVTIRSTPGIAMRIAARDEAAWQEISVSGDIQFAAALDHVCRNLQWDAEEDLARFFGDVVAHRMALTGRTLQQWGAQATDNLVRSFAEYWTEEQPLITSASDVERFNHDVDRLRDDIARVEKRIENLAPRRVADTRTEGAGVGIPNPPDSAAH